MTISNEQIIDFTDMQYDKIMLFTDAFRELIKYAESKQDFELAEILKKYIDKIAKINEDYNEKYDKQE